jgi:hypothetical protein
MDGEDSHRPVSLWRRWDDDDDTERTFETSETRLFELCALPLVGESLSDAERRPSDVDVNYLPGALRLALRNVPVLVFGLLVILLVEGELRSDVDGVSTLLPEVSLVPLVYLVVFSVGLLSLLVASDILDGKTLVKAAFVYGLGGVLLAGTVYSDYLTLTAREGGSITPHVVYAFPTLLFTLVLGLLAYDLLLRGENLFSKMGQKNIMDSEAYDEIKRTHLISRLTGDRSGLGPFRYGHIFTVLILGQFLFIWSFKGPLGSGLLSSLLLNSAINLVVLFGVFNFLVGITFLRNLLKGNYSTSGEDGERFIPDYLPYHPDRQGGYEDIGKMAMKINVIIILAGAYYVHRAYMAGLRTFPPTSDLPFAPFYADFLGIADSAVLEMVFWSVNFLGPILLYVIVVSFWFYYTFWEIHKQMVRQKKECILEWQIEERDVNADGEPDGQRGDDVVPEGAHEPVGRNKDEDKGHWTDLYDAPEWPVNTRRLGALVTGNIVPVVLSLPTVVPPLLAAGWG